MILGLRYKNFTILILKTCDSLIQISWFLESKLNFKTNACVCRTQCLIPGISLIFKSLIGEGERSLHPAEDMPKNIILRKKHKWIEKLIKF